jgi:hypothetical protein
MSAFTSAHGTNRTCRLHCAMSAFREDRKLSADGQNDANDPRQT